MIWQNKYDTWIKCEDDGNSIIMATPNDRIKEVIQMLSSAESYSSVVTSNSSTSDASITWNHENTLELLGLISVVGPHWPVIHDRMSSLEINPPHPTLVKIASDNDLSPEMTFMTGMDGVRKNSVDFYTELKDRFYHINRCLLRNESKFQYDGVAEKHRKLMLAEKFDVEVVHLDEEIKEAIARLQYIATTAALDQAAMDSRMTSAIESGVGIAPKALSDDNINLIHEFIPFVDALGLLYKPRGVTLVSQMVNSCADQILLSMKTQSKGGWLMSAGKDYHEAIQRILKATKSSCHTDGVPDPIDASRALNLEAYFANDKFTPSIHNCETFDAYAATLYEVCIIANFERQIRQVTQMANQWNSKLTEIRRNIRTGKRASKFLQKTGASTANATQ